MTTASNLKILRTSPLMLILMLLCSFTYGKVIYVDDDATGANDGSSWTYACQCLQNALMFAQQGDEIRVAQGIYKPDREIPPGQDGSVVTSGDRRATFQLIDGVDIKGGYAGLSGPNPNDREISLYETILSGDLNGNDNNVNDPCDLLTEPTRAENSYCVVTGLNVDCLLDGFTISGGHANGSSESGFGGGMNIHLSSVTITNCTFRNNATRHNGAALSSYSGSGPTLNNCIFTWNSSGNMVNVGSRFQVFEGGGGMYNHDNSPTLTNCTFIENAATIGGGMYNNDSNLTLTNCTFDENQALFFGGGIYNIDCNATLTDCIFTANSTERRGGGGMENWLSNLTLTNCTFRENFAFVSGGAMKNSANCNITLIDCLLRGNFANGSGGAMDSYSNNPTLNNCTFSENSTLMSGGGMYNQKANATLTNCTFSGNSAENSGGGIWNTSDSNSTLINCIYSGNRAEKDGGGMYNSNSNPTLINCTFSGNTAANWGGGINNSNSNVGLTNCTFTGNSSEIGNALACDSRNHESPSILELINCIVWDGDNGIWNNDGSIIFFEYSDVQGGWSGEGGDNIDADPLFVDADGADDVIGTEDDDLRLLPSSPCIDTGENSAIPESVITDVGGNPRIVNNTVDIGAYEFSMGVTQDEIKYGGGTGEPNDPYLIYTAEQMNAIGAEPNDWDKHFKLMADIDLKDFGGSSFNLIGSDSLPFKGVFDGNGYTISNLTYVITGDDEPAEDAVIHGFGLFKRINDPNAMIRDLRLVNPDIRPASTCGKRLFDVGALVGSLRSGSVSNCCIEGGQVQGERSVGGLTGSNWGTISDCYTTCIVGPAEQRPLANVNEPFDRRESFGGLVGVNCREILNCYAVGEISGEWIVGGLVGEAYGSILNSWSGGDVSGDYSIGGLIGRTRRSSQISHCYATGHVSGQRSVGGLVGSCLKDSSINSCYVTGNVSAEQEAGGLVGFHEGLLSECISIAPVSAASDMVGGLVGFNGGTIFTSWACGEVTGRSNIGGLVGNNKKWSQIIAGTPLEYDGIVVHSYARGSVYGESGVGGLVGDNSGTVLGSYSTGRVTGQRNFGGLVGNNGEIPVLGSFWDTETSGLGISSGGTGKTTTEMQTASTFLDVGWDFVDETANGTEDIWKITEGLSYPQLWWEKYGGGSGEPNDPYLIYTAEQLNTIGLNEEDADKHFKLMADIDLSVYKGDSFNRIGFYDPPVYYPYGHSPFTGVFDGNNHTISNFTYVVDANKPLEENGLWGDEDVGLFGVVRGAQAQIMNLGLIDPNIYPAITCTERVTSVGAIAGELRLGSITNCYVEGGRISADFTVGGLVGSNEGIISNCYTTCNVTWAKGRLLRPLDLPFDLNPGSFGGLMGFNRGQIYDCYTTGSIQGYNSSGGLIGHNYRDVFDPDLNCGVISNCYATGDVSGNEYVGGLAGQNSGEIHRCLALGNVSGLDKVGGLVGNMIMDEGSISHSYSIANVSGNEQVGGLVGYSNGTIQQSFAESEVSGNVYVGGLVGFNGSGTIHHSYSWGSVTGSENVGALSGRNGSGSIYYCYAVNAVNTVPESEYVGGLLGSNISGIVSACFWNIETSGLLDMCGLHFSDYDGCDNEYGKTTIEMQTAGTFLDAGWDFVDETANGTEDIWWILEGQDYPRLWWETEGN